jgi:cellulose synthase/poly-beta-1,6-N-acetylglucosamine synthase-like glycosyltransferase
VHEGREVHTQPHLDHLSVSSAIISLGSILLAYVLVSGMQLVPHHLCWLATVFILTLKHMASWERLP